MTDFFGKRVNTLKLFGQQRRGESSPGRVTGAKIFHAAGIVVDRQSSPQHIYIADTGNNRILGFRSYDSPKADIIFGQPDESSGAPNGDCNTGTYARPSRSSLCLINTPSNPNLGEQWMRLNIDVDLEGNLYVPDFHNNRVLMYRTPFARTRQRGSGDNLPDLVLGQEDFTTNGINRGRGPQERDSNTLYLSFGGFDHVASRGVSVDERGNVWVADTFNYRVLRFPRGETKADLVLGQKDFVNSEPTNDYAIEKAPLDRMCTPTLARVNPDTGELFVIDEYPGGFLARILVFKPPFRSGMEAERVIFPRQCLEGDYVEGYRFAHATGLVFNPVKTDDWIDETRRTHRYRDGVFWVHDTTRTMLLDAYGGILLAIAAPDLATKGGRFDVYGHAGMAPETPFNLIWPGGMIGFDAENNIHLADEAWHRISRFALPYRVGRTPDDKWPMLPPSNGGFFPDTIINTVGPANFSGPSVGAITFGNQLIVRDYKRYMAWDDYLRTESDGPDADVFVGQADGYDVSQNNLIYGRGMHTIDDQNQLWTCSAHGKLMVYELPLKPGATPVRELIPLYWDDDTDDDPTEIPYSCEQPLAFDQRTRTLWVYDTRFHRLLRVKNPQDLRGGDLRVDVVIGQENKTEYRRNRGMDRPDARSLGDVNDIRFDKHGNLFVVDNTYECHLNGRIIVFMAEDLASISEIFPQIEARLVFVVDNFKETNICRIFESRDRPHSPVSVAFNSRNEMVLGNDGYYLDPSTRHITQLYLYRDPLMKQTPDAVIEFPVGTPGELSFDDYDNLIIQDHTWSKLWVINLDNDPVWLRNLP